MSVSSTIFSSQFGSIKVQPEENVPNFFLRIIKREEESKCIKIYQDNRKKHIF